MCNNGATLRIQGQIQLSHVPRRFNTLRIQNYDTCVCVKLFVYPVYKHYEQNFTSVHL